MPTPALPSRRPETDSDALAHGADELQSVQARFAATVMRPLTQDWQMQPTWTDGRPTADVVSEFIKPNDRLTSFERIELYNRQYWFRLVDIMYEDYPGVAAILGEKRFNAFCKAYLVRYPSRSGLLRNLGRNIEAFIIEEPALTTPHTDMALDMARFEWSQVQAFDGSAKPHLTPDDLLGKDPGSLRLVLQPYLTLLPLRYAVDHLLIAVKKQVPRSEASNASDGTMPKRGRRKLPVKEPVTIVVHRLENTVYVKRLHPEAFAILSALHEGATLMEAIEAATPETADAGEWSAQVGQWFQLWMSFGWFCRK